MPVNPAPAARRALEVLDLLARDPSAELSLSEIARRLAMPRATCQAVLLALVDGSYLVRDDESITYTLGPACIRLGDAATEAAPLLQVAERAATRLARRSGLSTGVAARRRDDYVIVFAHHAGDPFTASLRTGQTLPLVAPFGAAWVAWADERTVEQWLIHEPPLAARDRRRMLAELETVRARGYAIARTPPPHATIDTLIDPDTNATADRQRLRTERMRAIATGDYLVGDVAPRAPLQFAHLSAPIFGHHGAVELVLMVLGPPHAVDPDALAQLGALLLEAAATDAFG